jgi:hypothetical protein
MLALPAFAADGASGVMEVRWGKNAFNFARYLPFVGRLFINATLCSSASSDVSLYCTFSKIVTVGHTGFRGNCRSVVTYMDTNSDGIGAGIQ